MAQSPEMRSVALLRASCPFRRLLFVTFAAGLLSVAGCGNDVRTGEEVFVTTPMSGSVLSGQQPLSSALVQLYALSGRSDGFVSVPLLATPVYTDDAGAFSTNESYSCPSATSALYVVASGGNPRLATGVNNSSRRILSLAGTCGDRQENITINEITTVAMISALAPFMAASGQTGIASGDNDAFRAALTTAHSLADFATGTVSGPSLAPGQTVPVQKLLTLADILVTCTTSRGGVAGDGSACGNLFSYTKWAQGAAPKDTSSAMLSIALSPTDNVVPIFKLTPFQGAFEPALTTAPNDWALTIASAVPSPILLPAPGTFREPQAVTLTAPGSTAQIHYTTDGSIPSASSQVYTQAIQVLASTTIRAVTLLNGLNSEIALGTYTIPLSIKVAPTAATLSASASQNFSASVVGTPNTGVTWTLTPAVGSISVAGVYRAPSTLSGAQTVTVRATSTADTTKTAAASVSLTPPAIPATQLVFAAQPVSANAGSWIAPVVSVLIEDTSGNLVPSSSALVTLELRANSAKDHLSGMLAVNAVNGVASFPGVSIDKAGSGYTLVAESDALRGNTSNAFSVAAALPVVQSRPADNLVDSIGLNVHFSYYGSIYTNKSAQLTAQIKQLGIRHLRDQMCWQGTIVSASPFYAIHNTLGNAGIKTDYILTSINYPMSQVQAYPSLVNDIEAVEASNEWDASGDASWANEILTQQRALYSQIHGTPSTSVLAVISPSLAQPQNAPALGNISSVSNAGDSHAYFAGWNPGNSGTGGANNPAYFMTLARINNPSQPIWITETGLWSDPGPYYGGMGISEQAMAIYSPRTILDFWNAGAAHTYIYELADWNSAIFFGLIREDGTIKPAFAAVKSLISTLSDPGTSFSPGKLAYSLNGAGSNVQTALFQKRDGSYYLAIWNEVLSYDVTNQVAIAVAAQPVTLQLGQPASLVETNQWDQNGNVTSTVLTSVQSVPLTVTDKLQIVKLIVQ